MGVVNEVSEQCYRNPAKPAFEPVMLTNCKIISTNECVDNDRKIDNRVVDEDNLENEMEKENHFVDTRKVLESREEISHNDQTEIFRKKSDWSELDKYIECAPASDDLLANNRGSIYIFSKVPIEQLPDDIRSFLPAIKLHLSRQTDLPIDQPDWLDLEKVIKGQEFARKYFYAVNFAEMLSLMILFAPPNGTRPLIYTEKSHTPFLAYKRYLSTALRVKSWYETEFWKPGTDGYRNLKDVRRLHSNVHERLKTFDKSERECRTNLERKLAATGNGLCCPLIESIRKDLSDSYRNSAGNVCPFVVTTSPNIVPLNQFEMSMTQIGFYGLLIAYPEKFGAARASDYELECFVHLWRYIGYMLGIADEYNSCKGTFEQVKRLNVNVIEYFIKPTMTRVTKEWEHMSRCAIKGINCIVDSVNFERSLLHLCHILDFEISTTLSRIGYFNVLLFKLEKLFLSYVENFPGLGKLLNYISNWKIKRATKFSPKRTKSIQLKCQYSSSYTI